MRNALGVVANFGLATLLVAWCVAVYSEWNMALGVVMLAGQPFHVLPWVIYGLGVMTGMCFLSFIISHLPPERASARWRAVPVVSLFWFLLIVMWFAVLVMGMLCVQGEERRKILRAFLFNPLPREPS